MKDPYSILGLSSDASMDEVTAAYRKLAKKYHPDLHPGDKSAEEKMSQINAAYEQIKSGKIDSSDFGQANGAYGPYGQPWQGQYRNPGDDPFAGFDFNIIFNEIFGMGWQQQSRQRSAGDMPLIRQIKMLLQNQQYQEAEHILEQIPDKDAQWHYLSALASSGLGNRVTALNHAKAAVNLDPNNSQYRQLLMQFERGGFTYNQTGQKRGFNMQTTGRSLLSMAAATLICFFCCRPC